MAELTVQEVTADGLEATYASAAGGGDFFTPTVNNIHVLHVVNGGASPITVTVNDPTSVAPGGTSGGATAFNPDIGVEVTNGESRFIKLDPRRLKDTATDQIDITYSSATSVTVAVLLVR